MLHDKSFTFGLPTGFEVAAGSWWIPSEPTVGAGLLWSWLLEMQIFLFHSIFVGGGSTPSVFLHPIAVMTPVLLFRDSARESQATCDGVNNIHKPGQRHVNEIHHCSWCWCWVLVLSINHSGRRLCAGVLRHSYTTFLLPTAVSCSVLQLFF